MRLLIALCLGLMFSTAASARDYAIDHLEPASWWVGMQRHRVELMVHGEAIAAPSGLLRRASRLMNESQRRTGFTPLVRGQSAWPRLDRFS